MKLESGPNQESSSQDGALELLIYISGLEKVGNAFVDKARKITYPLAFIASLVSYEMAHGVEIPKGFSYQEGLMALSDASVEEGFETGATFFRTEDGATRWHSRSGTAGKAQTLGADSDGGYSDEVTVLATIEELGADRGDVVRIFNIHNHPTPEGESMPPSGRGFMGAFSDTGKFVYDERQKFWDKLEVESGVDFEITNQVVDAQGIWTFELAENMRDSQYYELYTQGREISGQITDHIIRKNRLSEDELARLYEKQSEVKPTLVAAADHLVTLQFQWIAESKTTSVTELMQTPLYTELIDAYKNMGVVVSYEPFKN